MLRTLLTIVIGIAIGYFLGFGDAQKNDRHFVERLVDRAGGSMRDSLRNDIDARVDRVGR
jgi:hypothetical protein